MDGFPDGEVVIGLEDLFPAVGEGAVTGEDAEATGGEKFLMDFGNAVQDASETEGVVGPAPELAFEAETEGGGAVYVAEDPGFVVAVAPAETGENADVFGELLLG